MAFGKGFADENTDYLLAQLNLETDDEFGPFPNATRAANVWNCREMVLGSDEKRLLRRDDPATRQVTDCMNRKAIDGAAVRPELVFDYEFDSGAQSVAQTCTRSFKSAAAFRADPGGKACGSGCMAIGHTISQVSLEYFLLATQAIYEDHRQRRLASQFRREDGAGHLFNLETMSLAEHFRGQF